MKRLFTSLLFLLVCTTFLCTGQEKEEGRRRHKERSHDAEVHIGGSLGVGLGTLTGGALGTDISLGYCPMNDLCIGLGVGLRYSRVISGIKYQETDSDQVTSVKKGRLLLPVFLRGTYKFGAINTATSFVEPYGQLDLGYTIRLTASDTKPVIKGIYAEPVIGLCFNKRTHFGIGVNLQPFHYTDFTISKENDSVGIATALCFHIVFER